MRKKFNELGSLGLFSILISLFIVWPFFHASKSAGVILDMFLSVILICAIYASGKSKRLLFFALILGIPALLNNWISRFLYMLPFSILTHCILHIVFFFYISFVLLASILSEKKVTFKVIYGAVCVYFLIGLIWSFAYSLLEITQPGSFSSAYINFQDITNIEFHRVSLSNFIYYSFITLTTLGYGDITPVSPPAQMISSLEAVIGQLYLTILIARFVGIYISDKDG